MQGHNKVTVLVILCKDESFTCWNTAATAYLPMCSLAQFSGYETPCARVIHLAPCCVFQNKYNKIFFHWFQVFKNTFFVLSIFFKTTSNSVVPDDLKLSI